MMVRFSPLKSELIWFMLLLFNFTIPFTSVAQVTDSFTDGDFTSNPAWSGDDAKFEVNAAKQLHLNAPAVTDTAFISTSNSLMNDIEWDFFFIMDFSPSSSNYLKVFLASDQPNLKQPLNGYFLKMGEDGSNDGIDLYLKQGSTETLLISGIDGHVSANTNSISVKVTRDASGNWAVYSDITGGINYSLEGSATDNTVATTAWFGFMCKYTSTRSTSFYFDNIYVGPPVVDVTPPELVSITPLSSTQLDVLFSEAVEQAGAENESNYFVSNGVGNPSSAIRDGLNTSLVHLTFSTPFPNGTECTFTASSISDPAGNILSSASLPFTFYQAQGNDVVINEIMADPDPAVGLPAAEFVELYNRSQFAVDLTGWNFSDASTTQTLSSFTLLPNSYLILCDDATASQFTSYGDVMALTSFPSLNNDGDDLTLTDATSNIVNTVSYNISWYQDDLKSNGGYTLELIDPFSECIGKSNWHASVASAGGTPGTINSVVGNLNDTLPPQIVRATVITTSTIQLIFDGTLDAASAAVTSNYAMEPGITVLSALATGAELSTVDLQITPDIDSNTVYTITVNGLLDCAGNAMTIVDSAEVAIPSPVSTGSILINEILFNPTSGGYDYVEIYNHTTKIFDLKDLRIANTDDYDSLNTINEITPDSYLLFPDQYVVLTENSDWLQKNYFAQHPEWILQLADLPTYNDDEGTVVLLNSMNQRVDQLHYSADWQFALIDNVEGVSLERIDPDRPTQDSMNWHSAASTVGFGTPTYRNSQYSIPETGNEITLSPQVFSPDGDGFNDVLSISYLFDQAGYTANIKIFDSQGRETKNLVHNALLAQTGTFTWDGISENGDKARMGTYIVFVELFDLSGTVKRFKKVCVVASRKS